MSLRVGAQRALIGEATVTDRDAIHPRRGGPAWAIDTKLRRFAVYDLATALRLPADQQATFILWHVSAVLEALQELTNRTEGRRILNIEWWTTSIEDLRLEYSRAL